MRLHKSAVRIVGNNANQYNAKASFYLRRRMKCSEKSCVFRMAGNNDCTGSGMRLSWPNSRTMVGCTDCRDKRPYYQIQQKRSTAGTATRSLGRRWALNWADLFCAIRMSGQHLPAPRRLYPVPSPESTDCGRTDKRKRQWKLHSLGWFDFPGL